ncbi:MAG: sugar ABC transporter permease [Clostridiaceae bacterium]|nr:sugar ABC transporter permease [Clostridiaceae bacterium]
MNETKQQVSRGKEIGSLLLSNVRNYAMYVMLAIIFIVFNITTNGSFLTARNITNLVNQTGYVAVIAVGMTLILILQQIDLSVGYLAGFLGGVAAVLLNRGINVFLVVILVMLGGAVLGLLQGTIVGKLGVPAFITTLAGQFIFRGLLTLVTERTGTIRISNETFTSFSNGFIPSGFMINGRHGSALVIGAIAIVTVIISQVNERKDLKKYEFFVTPLPLFIFQLLFFSLLISALTYVLSGYNGISWTIIVVAVVTAIYNFMLNKMKLGRYIYGTGGNREAAELAGVNVKKIMVFAFISVGLMAALGGILYTSRIQSATPVAGSGFELDAIASCYIGGVSTSGGVGKVINSVVGAFVIMSLTNGLNLMGVGISYQYIIKGVIFILAVAFDVHSQGKKVTA